MHEFFLYKILLPLTPVFAAAVLLASYFIRGCFNPGAELALIFIWLAVAIQFRIEYHRIKKNYFD